MRRRVNPRQAKRMMQRMGLSMDNMPDVEQVVIKTRSKEIVIEEPDVAVLEVQGQRVFQVAGGNISEKAIEQKLNVAEEDVRLVADQTGKSIDEARRALEECDGDLAKAILLLQSKV